MDHQSTQAKSAVKSIAIDREAELRKIALSSLMAAAVAVAALQAYRDTGGTGILVTNSPLSREGVKHQLAELG
ncbi:MAG TPA: TIGR01459 family HAD-type hydrolase, partial [Alphaproteobacteria bacterium]|nr:TIGR01459 family HAD-type hydrolase [Alphaproteobacteria bacterium]